jgi:hypothetical protein
MLYPMNSALFIVLLDLLIMKGIREAVNLPMHQVCLKLPRVMVSYFVLEYFDFNEDS